MAFECMCVECFLENIASEIELNVDDRMRRRHKERKIEREGESETKGKESEFMVKRVVMSLKNAPIYSSYIDTLRRNSQLRSNKWIKRN